MCPALKARSPTSAPTVSSNSKRCAMISRRKFFSFMGTGALCLASPGLFAAPKKLIVPYQQGDLVAVSLSWDHVTKAWGWYVNHRIGEGAAVAVVRERIPPPT